MRESLKDNTALLIIDAQEKIINPIKDKDLIIKNIKMLLNAYQILGEDIYLSEQNPKKLGVTIPDLLPTNKYKLYTKFAFSLGYHKELKSLLEKSEFLSINCPATPETKKLIP